MYNKSILLFAIAGGRFVYNIKYDKKRNYQFRLFNYKFTSLCIGLLLLVFIYSGQAHAETGKAPDAKSVTIGKQLYTKYCQQCHQKGGVGETPISIYIRKPGYVTAMPLNEASHAWHHGDKQLAHTILNGTRASKRMPAWKGTLSQQQAMYVVAYIKSLWSPRIIACQGPRHMSCMR